MRQQLDPFMEKLLTDITTTYANNLFNELKYHPEYRGSKFTWEEFPAIAAGMASKQAFLYFSDWDNLTEEKQVYIQSKISQLTLKKTTELVQSIY